MTRDLAVSIGDVRAIHGAGRPSRVLVADDVEVMSDVWWDHLRDGAGGWAIQRLDARHYYDRVPTSLARRAPLVRRGELSADELAVHRPDLPLRVLRNTGWCFSPITYESIEAFVEAAAARGVEVSGLADSRVLEIDRVVVVPQGPVRGFKRSELLSADDRTGFAALELLFKLHRVQAKYLKHEMPGAGLYRLGCEKRLPSFYIGGNRDLAGFLPDGVGSA